MRYQDLLLIKLNNRLPLDHKIMNFFWEWLHRMRKRRIKTFDQCGDAPDKNVGTVLTMTGRRRKHNQVRFSKVTKLVVDVSWYSPRRKGIEFF